MWRTSGGSLAQPESLELPYGMQAISARDSQGSVELLMVHLSFHVTGDEKFDEQTVKCFAGRPGGNIDARR